MGKRLLVTLFALGLAWTILIGTILPSNARQPKDRQELETWIKQHAARHAKKGEAQTDRILNTYRNNPVGLTPIEIEEIYETEYDRLKPSKSLLEKAFNKFPKEWAMLISLIVGVLGTTFKDQIKKRFTKVWEWLFQRLAGNPLLHNLALRRYQRTVIDKYSQVFIPFRPYSPLPMDQIYVALKVSKDSIKQPNQGVKAGLDAAQAVRDYSRLMVTGAPGSGKTMLLRYLFFSYAQGQLLLPGRPVLVLLELNRLKKADLTQEDLILELVQVFNLHGWPKANSFVRQQLNQGKLMLLLDGLDEVSSNARPQVVACIKDLLETYRDCRAVISCRTMVYSGQFDPPITDKRLDVIEFSDQQIRRFLGAWEEKMPPEGSLKELLQTLSDRPRIMALARNPLLLTIIAFLYSEGIELPYSRARFYEESTRFLLGQWQKEHNKYEATEKHAVLKHLALFNQKRSGSAQNNLRSIKYSELLEQLGSVLPNLNRNSEQDTQPISREIVERSGLLLRLDGGENYQFAHLTLQEYFAAEALKEKEAELIQRFWAEPGTWREVVKLWCGLSSDSTNLITSIYQQDAITGFECLADALSVQEAEAERIIGQFKSQLTQAGGEDTIAQAFGTVASNSRTRGDAVFQFLADTLACEQNNLERRQGAANALSWTNLSKAVPELSQQYKTDALNLREPLVRMGNLAVPALAHWIKDDDVWKEAMSDLAEIATPEAAMALVHWLWNEDSCKATRAAWYLGMLIADTPIEKALEKYTLNESQRQALRVDWIWSPFPTTSESTLPIVAGRIAYQIGYGDLVQIPRPVPLLDPRLAIPLCTIEILDRNQIPNSLTDRAEFLLEQPEMTHDLVKATRKEVEALLLKARVEISPNRKSEHTLTSLTSWNYTLSSLNPRQQLDLLVRLINTNRELAPNDWRSLYQYLEYDFKKGWHYYLTLITAFLMSLFALWGVVIALQTNPDSLLVGWFVLIIFTFWVFLLLGIEGRLEPNVFMRVGLQGPMTFWNEFQLFWQDGLILGGGETLYRSVAVSVAVSMAVSVALLGALALGMVGADKRTVAKALFGVMTVVGALALGVSGAEKMTVARALFGVMTVVGALALGVALARVGIVGVALAWLSGYGIELLSRNDPPRQSWLRFTAIFAFPFFCWLPITTWFATVTMMSVLSENSHSLFMVILIELVILGLCTILWKWGQYRDRQARNPLYGILGDKPAS
ncbi:NACHT domain-containing protein [Acaryochloris sp. IP29b_bin.137]|uniref:NACHT domain-containing protein n=1 Tax=Acaryochloris sp. IP29b_bin.137 TaxID=2969217 RepID=UPI002634B774|nr:NACHT domain-containing protein [Acaryochloris sp. IP29b_bin.137]